MELEWLEDFLSVARSGSFSRSAEERFVTQPAFSRRIRALELWLGTPLVDRSTYPTRLTPAGCTFRDSAEDTLRRLYAARDELRGSQGISRDVVGFAAMHTVALWFFPTWLQTIERQLGPITTRMIADNMHNCLQFLVEGNCDFLLCFAHPAMPILLEPTRHPYLVLGNDRLIPVTARGPDKGPLYRLPGAEAAPIPYLGYAPESFLGRAVDLVLGKRATAHHLSRCYENSMAESLKCMALARHGLAWLPEGSIQRELKSGRMLRAGGRDWDVPLEVRIYRSAGTTRPKVEALWSMLAAAPQSAARPPRKADKARSKAGRKGD